MVILPATPDLVRTYYGGPPPWTMRGHVAMIDDRVVGVGGVHFATGSPVVLSDMSEELQARKKDVARCARFLEKAFNGINVPIYAIAKLPTSVRLLIRLGFRPTGEVDESGTVLVRQHHA